MIFSELQRKEKSLSCEWHGRDFVYSDQLYKRSKLEKLISYGCGLIMVVS